MDEILEEAEDNEDVAKWLQKNMSKVLEAMIKDDLDLELEGSDLDELLELVEDDDFIDNYMDEMEELNESFSDEKSYMLEDLRQLELTFDIDYTLLNRIKRIDLTVEESGDSIALLMSFNENNKPKKEYNLKNGDDIMDLDEEDYYEIIMDTYDVLIDNISDNEELEDYLNDVAEDEGYEDYEELMDDIIYDMTYYMY